MFNEGDVLYKQKANQARNRPKDFLYTEQLQKQNCPPEQFTDGKKTKKNLKMQKTNKNFIKRKTVIT